MTNQDNLPVWAKILLGIPAEESALPHPAETEEPANSSKREANPSEAAVMEQSAIVFGTGTRKHKWNWATAFCPAAREAS
jgi:hypothetical protein